MASLNLPGKSTLSHNKKALNSKWQIFKDSILQASKLTLKMKHRNPHVESDVSEQLITIRSHLTSLNKIFAFITTLLYPNSIKGSTGYAQFQHQWSKRANCFNLRATFMDITTYLAFHIDPADVPLDVNNSTLPQFKLFRAKVAALRNLIRNKRSLLEKERTDHLIKEFEDD